MKPITVMAVLAVSLLSLSFTCMENNPTDVHLPGGDGRYGDTVVHPPNPPQAACFKDSDCVLVKKDCCGCQANGESIAVHKDWADSYTEQHKKYCASQPRRMCSQQYRCGEIKVQCFNRVCSAVNLDYSDRRRD